jgi:cobalt-precorrin 5A hydrolase
VSDPVVVTLTPAGYALGCKLIAALGRGKVVAAQGKARQILPELFQTGQPLICVMALGIVVRLLGPLTRAKATDPPVVAVDEAGNFAISVLGGHAGGANALAKQVATALGALPVITTASDSLGLPPVDLIGQEWGWQIEHRENLTKVAAAVVRGDNIGVYQEAGRRDWWQAFGEWPATFQPLSAWPPVGPWAGLLVISDRRLPALGRWPTVLYRPRSLVLGTGCRRGVPCDEIEALFQQICQTHGFVPECLAVVATVSLKGDEPGLLEFAARHNVPLTTYTPEMLARVGPLPTPSAKVLAKIGIAGVAEPAAMLAAGTDRLLLPKVRGPRVTMALARREA